MKPVCFQVEQLWKDQTNYGYWTSGGYDPERQYGQFRIAVSPYGRPLKEVERMREQNGKHVLHVVYPGCYILQATCKEAPVIEMEFFRIQEIDQKAAKAVCERVLEEDMTQQQYDRMQPSMDLARMECITPYNQNNHYYWRGRNE